MFGVDCIYALKIQAMNLRLFFKKINVKCRLYLRCENPRPKPSYSINK